MNDRRAVRAMADRAQREAQEAAERARYQTALAEALQLDRMALVSRDGTSDGPHTVTAGGRIVGEVFTRSSGVLTDWWAQPDDPAAEPEPERQQDEQQVGGGIGIAAEE